MKPSREAPQSTADDSQLSSGEVFRIPLTCPECGMSGSIDWKSLKNGIGCPACGCRFLIGRNGQVLSQAELPHMRYACPRCKQSGLIPTLLVGRGTSCPGCHLPLAPGPDQRLHPAPVAAEMWRVAGESAGRSSIVEWCVAKCVASNGRVRRQFVVACSVAAVGLLLGVALLLHSLFDNSPETMARRFVVTCLSGDWDAALAYMEDNAVQRTEFKRWRTQHFTSILDKHRPKGDRVTVTMRVLEESQEVQVMLVSLTSPFLGTRSSVQHWCQHDGNWLFDAHKTLFAQAGVSKSRRASTKQQSADRRS